MLSAVIFYTDWRGPQFNIDSEQQIFWETLHGNFIYSQSFYQKSAEGKSPKEYFLYFILMSGLGLESWLYVKYWKYQTFWIVGFFLTD